jgi:hypothetical protein
VIHRILAPVAVICSLLIVTSFALFARDQLAGASQQQQNELAATASPSSPTAPAPAPHTPGQPRRFIDGAAKALTSPFDSVVQSNSAWVDHGVPTLMGLLVYGVGIGFLARYTSGLA